MESNATIWTDAFLEGMRQHTDPLADGVVSRIIENGHTDEINLIFKSLRSNADLQRDSLPPILKEYFEAASKLPRWADEKLLDKGATFFGVNGLEIAMLLNYKSLPSAYVCPNGAAVLHASGRLEEIKGSTEKFQRRLMETAQFVFNVCAPNAFRPNGRGIESAMKVRLMHAAIRYYIRRGVQWDSKALGEPINQEDLTGTMLSFSSLVQEGLDQMGIKNPPELARGYYHLWQVTGHLMGVDPRMIPAKQEDGHTLGWKILNRNMGSSVAGTELTKALVAFTRESIPPKAMRHLAEVFIRHYCGDKIADNLEVKRYGWFRRRLFPMFIDWFMSDVEKVTHIRGFNGQLSGKLTRHLLQHTIDKYYGYKKVEFYIPTSLRGYSKLSTHHSPTPP